MVWLRVSQGESNGKKETDVVDESHLCVKSWVNVIHRKELSFNGIGISRDDTPETASPPTLDFFAATALDIACTRHTRHTDIFLVGGGHAGILTRLV